MLQINRGTLKTNKPMSAKNLLKALEILGDYNPHLEETEISFEEAYGYLEQALDKLVDDFFADGITIEGEIQYYVDFEGIFEYRPGCHAEHEEVKLLREHEDEKLIAELVRRGYRVTKR